MTLKKLNEPIERGTLDDEEQTKSLQGFECLHRPTQQGAARPDGADWAIIVTNSRHKVVQYPPNEFGAAKANARRIEWKLLLLWKNSLRNTEANSVNSNANYSSEIGSLDKYFEIKSFVCSSLRTLIGQSIFELIERSRLALSFLLRTIL